MLNGIKIPFSRLCIDKAEKNKILQVLQSGWLTTGRLNKEFEKKFAKYVGAKYCVLVNSCTAALFLSLKYLQNKYKEIKKVYTPSFTYAAAAHEIIHAGLKIVWGDVDQNGLLVLPLKQTFDLAIPSHYAGLKAPINYAVPVIEDSAHLIEKDQCKNNKNLVCFSFYATKNLTMGEGGAICTNDKNAYQWFIKARSHGITKDGFQRYHGNWRYDIDFIGWKANLSDLQAAVGLAQLDKFEEMQEKRKKIVGIYNKSFGLKNNGLHLYPIFVKNRDKFIETMSAVGIQTSVHFIPLHQMTAYKNYETKKTDLPQTEWLGQHIVSLPLYPDLSGEQIKYICKHVLAKAEFIK